MRGKQSSKISLKKRLLKRWQTMTKRWNKQSTRRHLLVYLLCDLLLVGSLYGCIFAIPNVRDVRTVRTEITDVHRSRVTDSVLLGVYAVITLGGLVYLLLLCKT